MSQATAPRPARAGIPTNLLSLYLPGFVLALGTGVALPALPVYAKSFDVTFGVASLVIVMNMLGSAVAAIPTGYLVDRFGRRKIMLLGPIISALASFLIAAAQVFPELLVYRFIEGAAAQMWLLARLTSITDTGGGARGRQITGLFAADAAGRLLGPTLGGLAATWDIRLPFVIYGVMALIAAIPTYLLVADTRPAPPRAAARGGPEAAKSRWGFVGELLVPTVILLLSVQLLVALTRGTLWGGTLNLYAVYAYDIGPAALGVLVATAAAVGLPISISAGHLMDRFGRKAMLVPGLFLTGLGLAAMALIAWFHLPLATYVVALLAVSLSQSMTTGSMQTLASDVAPPHMRGRFFGIWRTVGNCGTFTSPLLFAFFADNLGYPAGFTLLAVLGLSAAFLLWTRVPETFRPAATAPPATEADPASAAREVPTGKGAAGSG
jgi:MFS family permease